MRKILEGLEPCFWVATIILFLYWLPTPHDISGWVWFSTLMTAVFLSEYNSKN